MPIITLAGDKYRYLNVGEVIENGDVLVPDDNGGEICPGYLPVWKELVGTQFDESMEPIVRKVI